MLWSWRSISSCRFLVKVCMSFENVNDFLSPFKKMEVARDSEVGIKCFSHLSFSRRSFLHGTLSVCQRHCSSSDYILGDQKVRRRRRRSAERLKFTSVGNYFFYNNQDRMRGWLDVLCNTAGLGMKAQTHGLRLRQCSHSSGRRRPLDIPFHVSNSAKLLFSSRNKMINDSLGPSVHASSEEGREEEDEDEEVLHLFIASSKCWGTGYLHFHFPISVLNDSQHSNCVCDVWYPFSHLRQPDKTQRMPESLLLSLSYALSPVKDFVRTFLPGKEKRWVRERIKGSINASDSFEASLSKCRSSPRHWIAGRSLILVHDSQGTSEWIFKRRERNSMNESSGE